MFRPCEILPAMLACVALSTGSACLASASTSPSTQPTLQSLKQEEYVRQLQEKSALAHAKQGAIDKFIRISVRDEQLVVDTKIETFDWLRMELDNPLLLCTVRRPPHRDFFQLTLDDFTDPHNVYVQTEIISAPQQLQIVGSWELENSERFVTLIDRYASLDEQGRKIAAETRLLVQEMSESGENNVNFTLTAPNWPALVREHPQEIRKYLRPVLAELHNTDLLRPDSHTEWQIFGPRVSPDPATSAAVQKLLPQLDSESFSQRQHTMRELAALGTAGAVALMHVDQRSLSTEQSARITDLLLPYRQLSAPQAEALSQQPTFLLDCMDADDADLRRLAGEQLASVLKHPIVFDPNSSWSVREEQLSKLRQNLLPSP